MDSIITKSNKNIFKLNVRYTKINFNRNVILGPIYYAFYKQVSGKLSTIKGFDWEGLTLVPSVTEVQRFYCKARLPYQDAIVVKRADFN